MIVPEGVKIVAEPINTPVNTTVNIDKLVFRFAGIFVLLSVALSHYHHPYWLWFTAFVGLNMLQASFTGFCPLASLMSRLGVRYGMAFGGSPQ